MTRRNGSSLSPPIAESCRDRGFRTCPAQRTGWFADQLAGAVLKPPRYAHLPVRSRVEDSWRSQRDRLRRPPYSASARGLFGSELTRLSSCDLTSEIVRQRNNDHLDVEVVQRGVHPGLASEVSGCGVVRQSQDLPRPSRKQAPVDPDPIRQAASRTPEGAPSWLSGEPLCEAFPSSWSHRALRPLVPRTSPREGRDWPVRPLGRSAYDRD